MGEEGLVCLGGNRNEVAGGRDVSKSVVSKAGVVDPDVALVVFVFFLSRDAASPVD